MLLEAHALAIGHRDKTLFTGLDLWLGAGEVLCLLGPNGVGKTTLFRTLLGLLPARGGALHLEGRPLGALARREIARAIAYVPQAQTLPFAFTARDIVLMGRAATLPLFATPGPAAEREADAALDRLGIGDLGPRDMSRLSGGQQQMVLIARAVAQGARALVMDEPTASLDLANRKRIDDLIRNLARDGKGVVLSTHDPDQAAALADRVILLGRSGLVASGPAHEVMTAENLSALYGTRIRREALSDGALHFRPD
ncbi:ABC transporter ATP-binding protein [Paracoccus aminophilus]|uniref:Iron complex transport system, ATP-binding protein n=1 Tax=Paracoccus aminophilus JCM 7686 TaxID=1367847 RepID=S5XXE8_PARAH|nr:ABC transporter ATP-binding protein [Paracoccus aminophilus]AGT08100.1 iron complex transport system, ATP-binding protein [Paracoccus aminophilus JCM 7686]